MLLDNYPFGHVVLLRGLRRYLDTQDLHLLNVEDMPLPSVMPGAYEEPNALRSFVVELQLSGMQHRLGLTLQEGDANLIKREHGFYKRLAEHLPIIVPGYVIGDDAEGWLILEGLSDLRPPEQWTVDDYREAVDNLALLNDRFWGLEEDLDNFMCLWRPLDQNYPSVHEKVWAASQSLIDQPTHSQLDTSRSKAMFHILVEQLEVIKAPLLEQALTLTHGSYWAGNIARPLDGRQIITYWRYASIAPAILDVVMFYQCTLQHLQPAMSIDAAIERYRVQLAQRQGKTVWSDEEWERVWDYALMWLFAVHWMPRLAEMPAENYTLLHDQIHVLWISPVQQAIEKHLKITLPE